LTSLGRQGEGRLAERLARYTVELAPSEPRTWLTLANALVLEGNYVMVPYRRVPW